MTSTTEKAVAVLSNFVKCPVDIVVESLPNLKTVARDAIAIVDLIQEFKSNTTAWASFGEYIAVAVIQVFQAVNDSLVLPLVNPQENNGEIDPPSTTGDSKQSIVRSTQFVQNLESLHSALSEVKRKIAELRAKPLWKRIYGFYNDPDYIDELRKRVEDVVSLFHLSAVTHVGLNLDKVAADVERNIQHTKELAANLNQVAVAQTQHTHSAVLDRLPYASKASWDESKICFPDTRRQLLSDLEDWIHRRSGSSSTNAEVMIVPGVVGSGKSTLMHTLAQRCASQAQLGSAFFFNQAVKGRNNISNLFTTIAIDLCAFDQELASQIVASTSRDRGLSSATPLRQFEELVFKPLSTYQRKEPLVIIIDALDEAISIQSHKPDVLLEILRDRVPDLPSAVRFVVTYRTHPTLDSFFRGYPHICTRTIDTRNSQSYSDISLFIRHELNGIAQRKHLTESWPSEQDVQLLIDRAEGLFQWAAMICGYLARSPNPSRDLKSISTNLTLSGTSPEAKMDGLYKAVLSSYQWDESGFSSGFKLVMGTILAAKTPLSGSALHSLHRMSSIPIDQILQQISSLVTGWSSENPTHPIHIIHQSLREYLTSRATECDKPMPYSLSEKQSSQELALPCLMIINQQLDGTTPGTGYIHGTPSFEIPNFPRNRISEELLYAVQFWTDHLVDGEAPVSASLAMALRTFFSQNLVHWMEVVCVYGQYQGLKKVVNWVMTNLSDRAGIIKNVINASVAKSLKILSQHLIHMDRRDQALKALQDAVELYQKFEPGVQTGIDADMSRSMRLLSTQLTQAGRDDEAISASEMTLIIDRRLVEENPGEYLEQLGASLDTYATVMSKAGRNAESFPHIRESVEIYQQLAERDPGRYSDDLARCLNNLAAHLGRMGRHEEALPTIRDALSAYRYLAQEQPDIHTAHLANALSNYYAFLSGAGRREEALPHIEEAVGLYRQLTAERPAAYAQNLASALCNYAAGLSEVGRETESLPIMVEAIELLRAEYAERPDANIAKLATALFNMSSHLNISRNYSDALPITIEAIELYQTLNERHPGMHNSSLGALFSRLHRNYIQLDQEDDAFAAILEAVRYFRETSHTGNGEGTSHVQFAIALKSLANSYAKMGLEEECLEPSREAVDILRIATAAEPENYKIRYALGQSLMGLNKHLVRAGKGDESYICATEAVDIYRELAGILPTEYTDDLAEAYGSLASSLQELDRDEEALAAAIEHLSLYRACADDDPLKWNPKVLEAYVTVIKSLISLGYQDMVIEMMSDMMGVYRTIMATNPESISSGLANMFERLCSTVG